ncbi:transmembrane protease serine 2-like [Sabethes cyaneus]|uniref:transmembrane protease serine 2-like n=1 Tax=Sabethes cyaneus TaxID=53552 RepID=UPI00237D8727|nr:transmembrane protease serine 2-like [Sabethes cyaneus]
MTYFLHWIILTLSGLFPLIHSHNSTLFPEHLHDIPCSSPSIKDGVCVYAYLCKNGKIITDGSGLLDLRMSDECDDYMMKCCSKRTRCAWDNGLCIPEENCGVDLNDPKFSQFKDTNDCDWSGYKCCPQNYVDKEKQPTNVPVQLPDECDGGLCVPNDQCLATGDELIQTNRRKCTNNQHICCPSSRLHYANSDSCTFVGGRCVPENTCLSEISINIRVSQCESPGYVCCNVDALIPDKAPADGKACFNGRGKCTEKGNCHGAKYTDRRNECEGLTCCGSVDEPKPTVHPKPTVQPVPIATESPQTELPDIERAICSDNGGLCRLADDCADFASEQFEDCGEKKVCCYQSKASESSTDREINQLTPSSSSYSARNCGYRNMDGVHFGITGAENGESQYGEFPWVIAIFAKTRFGSKFICGGTIIDPEVVLTTADCLNAYKTKYDALIVRAGEWDMQSLNEPQPYKEQTVRLIKVHPAFKSTSLVNNVALIFLNDRFDFSSTIESICLPPQDYEIDNGYVTAAGWGVTPTNRNNSQQILKSLDLPYVSPSECERVMRRQLGNSKFKLHDSFLCAGGEPLVDTCRGDAGSPVIFPIPDDIVHDRVYLVGMVSWGIGCGRPGVPAAYTAVAKFRNWIDEQMEQQQLKDSSYYYVKEDNAES